jgi:putative nucleotidyltransferase-like protein
LAKNPVTITDDQRLLLQAALEEPDRALRCFIGWWQDVKLENTGGTEYRLLPLVYHNIGRLIPDAITAARVKGVAKHVWLSNQLNAALAKTVLNRLNAANIPSVIIKGSAMMAAVSEKNTRLMGDCDILVDVDRAPQALATLRELGLTSPHEISCFTAADYSLLHGLTMVREGAQKALIDIHWRPFRNVGTDELTREFFEQSVPCLFSDQPTRRPCFPHMLLHVIVHGTEWAVVPRYDWFADAVLILRKAGSSFDWDLLAETAARYRLGSIVRRGLGELTQTFDVPVPADAFRQLPRESFIDGAEARWRHRPPSRMRFGRRSIMKLQAYRRRDLQLAGKPAWAVVPEIWRSVFGPPPRIQLHAVMAADANDHIIYLSGWYEHERGGRWSNGPLAALSIQRAPGRKADLLRIVGYPMQPAPDQSQIIDVFSGWRRLGRLTWGVSSSKTCVGIVQLPVALSRREVLTLQFRIAKPTSPADVGPSEDVRQLGIFLQDIRTLSLCIRDATQSPLKFHRDSGDLPLLLSGWSEAEAKGCWTDGSDASLGWTTPVDVPRSANLVIRGEIFALANETLKGSISINGRKAGDFVRPRGEVVLSVPIFASTGAADIHVRLQFNNPKSPHEAGLSSDQRKLALFLTSIGIET